MPRIDLRRIDLSDPARLRQAVLVGVALVLGLVFVVVLVTNTGSERVPEEVAEQAEAIRQASQSAEPASTPATDPTPAVNTQGQAPEPIRKSLKPSGG